MLCSPWNRRLRHLFLAAALLSVGLAGGLLIRGPWAPPVRGQVTMAPSGGQTVDQTAYRQLQDWIYARSAATTQQGRRDIYAKLSEEISLLETQSRVVKTVAQLMSPTVVHLEAEKNLRGSDGRPSVVEEAGSGVLVSVPNHPGEIFVLTNSHVIRDAPLSKISISLVDGRRLRPVRLYEDPATDVAVIRVRNRTLVTARMGDSDALEVGDFVMAMGSPFGLNHSITFGIVSAKGRRDLELGDDKVQYQDFIQTDAAINPGNSGGPLVNLRGEVVGVNTAIASNSGGNEGIGFSIPINMVMHIAQELIEHGYVNRAFLGVTLDGQFGPAKAADLGLPAPRGAHVTAVRPGTPAAEVELLPGDVILQFNGVRVEDDAHLINIVGLTKVGHQVPMIIWRQRRVVSLQVAVGQRSEFRRSQPR